MNYLYAALAAIALLIGAEQWGEHVVTVEWDKDKAVRQALLDSEINRNKETLDALKAQHQKDQSAATSKAGRDAVDRFIRERLLSSCASLQPGGHAETQSVEGTDGAASQPRTSEPLAEFVTGCGQDALKVMRWQELCTRMNCEVY